MTYGVFLLVRSIKLSGSETAHPKLQTIKVQGFVGGP